ncbi:TatD family hydrolase [Candidatus Omnitrophota bacterium]
MISGLIDTHAHLDQIEELDAVLQRAHEAGLEAIIAVGTDYESSKKIIEISQKQNPVAVFSALGVHPSEIDKPLREDILTLIEENRDKIVAVGEIGLDYWFKPVKKDKSKREIQKEIFQKQLNIAKALNLPVVIHSRGAWEDCLLLCQESGIQKALFHWYSGPINILDKILKANYFISATPSLYYSSQLQDAVKHVPLDHLLVETDCPVFYKNAEGGFSAEPKDVVSTIQLVSQMKQMKENEIAQSTLENAKRFFNLS